MGEVAPQEQVPDETCSGRVRGSEGEGKVKKIEQETNTGDHYSS